MLIGSNKEDDVAAAGEDLARVRVREEEARRA
jgi:hypothetical protein